MGEVRGMVENGTKVPRGISGRRVQKDRSAGRESSSEFQIEEYNTERTNRRGPVLMF